MDKELSRRTKELEGFKVEAFQLQTLKDQYIRDVSLKEAEIRSRESDRAALHTINLMALVSPALLVFSPEMQPKVVLAGMQAVLDRAISGEKLSIGFKIAELDDELRALKLKLGNTTLLLDSRRRLIARLRTELRSAIANAKSHLTAKTQRLEKQCANLPPEATILQTETTHA